MTFLATALTATLMSCLHFCLLFTQARYPNAWHVLTLQGLYCNNISHLSLLSHQRLLSGLDTGTHCSLSEQFFGFSGETEEPMTLSFYMTSKIASSTWSHDLQLLHNVLRAISGLPEKMLTALREEVILRELILLTVCGSNVPLGSLFKQVSFKRNWHFTPLSLQYIVYWTFMSCLEGTLSIDKVRKIIGFLKEC